MSITFHGHQNKPWTLVDQHFIFAICSYSEGFPNVLIEAMYNNLVIIAPDLPYVKQILDFISYDRIYLYSLDSYLSFQSAFDSALKHHKSLSEGHILVLDMIFWNHFLQHTFNNLFHPCNDFYLGHTATPNWRNNYYMF